MGQGNLLLSVKNFLNICQYRRCFAALRHLLRPWPVNSTLAIECEELLYSLRMVRAVAREKLAPEELTSDELKALSGLISRIETRLYCV
jgi:hypothetical protein